MASAAQFVLGPSWSLHRDVACFFASVYPERFAALPQAYPCVVSVSVPRRYALAHLTGRSEVEVVAFTRRLKSHIIDGANMLAAKAGFDWRPSDGLQAAWREAGERWHAQIQCSSESESDHADL